MESIDIQEAIKLSVYLVEALDDVKSDDLRDDVHHGLFIFGNNTESMLVAGQTRLVLNEEHKNTVKKYIKQIVDDLLNLNETYNLHQK